MRAPRGGDRESEFLDAAVEVVRDDLAPRSEQQTAHWPVLGEKAGDREGPFGPIAPADPHSSRPRSAATLVARNTHGVR